LSNQSIWEVYVNKAVLLSMVVIALTDVALQLDNALAISSVASGVPSGQRFLVLGGGVLLAAVCLFGFTLIGSTLIDRLTWLKPVAGAALLLIGGQLIWSWFRS
jgi:predicted tellurium resistance membrane protein TerC